MVQVSWGKPIMSRSRYLFQFFTRYPDLALTVIVIVHTLQLGFDADILELLLRELNDVVDKFFVIESTRTHNKVCMRCDLMNAMHQKHAMNLQSLQHTVSTI